MFLAQGLKRGDKCILVAPAEAQEEILMKLNDRRKAPRHLVVSEGFGSADAQFAFLKRVSKEAKQAGQTMCLAADMSWTLSRNLRIDAVLDVERRLNALAGQAPLAALCVYDARHFSSADFLRAMKCHRDHSQHSIVLG
jgi:KaiC/GvpD/RAD55 family RecA-like ATPase